MLFGIFAIFIFTLKFSLYLFFSLIYYIGKFENGIIWGEFFENNFNIGNKKSTKDLLIDIAVEPKFIIGSIVLEFFRRIISNKFLTKKSDAEIEKEIIEKTDEIEKNGKKRIGSSNRRGSLFYKIIWFHNAILLKCCQ